MPPSTVLKIFSNVGDGVISDDLVLPAAKKKPC